MDAVLNAHLPIRFNQNTDELTLRLYIQPKASRDKIMGIHDNEIKIAITAPPVDGQANQHLTKFLAKQFKVAKGSIIIEKGELGRHKQVKVLQPSIIPDEIAVLMNNLEQ